MPLPAPPPTLALIRPNGLYGVIAAIAAQPRKKARKRLFVGSYKLGRQVHRVEVRATSEKQAISIIKKGLPKRTAVKIVPLAEPKPKRGKPKAAKKKKAAKKAPKRKAPARKSAAPKPRRQPGTPALRAVRLLRKTNAMTYLGQTNWVVSEAVENGQIPIVEDDLAGLTRGDQLVDRLYEQGRLPQKLAERVKDDRLYAMTV